MDTAIQPLILCCCCPPHITCSVVLTTSHQHRCYQRMDTSAVAVNPLARPLVTCDLWLYISTSYSKMLITLNNSLDEVFEVVNKYSKESEMMEEDFYLIPTTVIEQETHTDSTKVCLNIASYSTCTLESRASINTNHESINWCWWVMTSQWLLINQMRVMRELANQRPVLLCLAWVPSILLTPPGCQAG